jgi:hypothetical protein
VIDVAAVLYAALQSLVAGECYPDEAPVEHESPYMVILQTSGEPLQTLLGDAVPTVLARWQIEVWHAQRAQAGALADQAIAAMAALNAAGTLANAFEDMDRPYDPETGLYGARLVYFIPH